jgi:hypothetical protein
MGIYGVSEEMRDGKREGEWGRAVDYFTLFSWGLCGPLSNSPSLSPSLPLAFSLSLALTLALARASSRSRESRKLRTCSHLVGFAQQDLLKKGL